MIILFVHQRASLLPTRQLHEVPFHIYVEYYQWHVPVIAKRESCLVQNPEVLAHGFVEGQLVIFRCARVFFWVGLNAAPESVVKNGLPVPPQISATPPSSSTFTALSRL